MVCRLAILLGVVLAVCCTPVAAEEPRTWTDESGQFSAVATLVEVRVVLRGENGRAIEVALGRLSEADQQYVRDAVGAAVANATGDTEVDVEVIVGTVATVAAGDTLIVLDDDQTQHKVRLRGIDAPEGKQPLTLEARKTLAQKVFQKPVRVQWREKDEQESVLGDVYLDGRWINKELLEEGWARHDASRCDDQELAQAEAEAKTAGRGLWANVEPATASDPRNAAATDRAVQVPAVRILPQDQAAADVIVYVTENGTKYHRAGCSYLSNSSIPMPLSEAKRRYSPCSRCQPPK